MSDEIIFRAILDSQRMAIAEMLRAKAAAETNNLMAIGILSAANAVLDYEDCERFNAESDMVE